jgi:hypothetical protein
VSAKRKLDLIAGELCLSPKHCPEKKLKLQQQIVWKQVLSGLLAIIFIFTIVNIVRLTNEHWQFRMDFDYNKDTNKGGAK